MSPVKIVAGLLVLASAGALFQGLTAERPGKKLALASIRYALEERTRTDRDGLVRDAFAAKARLRSSDDPDTIFRDVVTVWLAREPSPDLTRPTITEFTTLPTGDALLAVRKLGPDTGFEGARIRALFESRRKTPREQQGILARLVSAKPSDGSAVRAYNAALRLGVPEERRKAIELAREYVGNDDASRQSRLTLLLALHDSVVRQPDAKLLGEAKALAAVLAKEIPETSSSAEAVRALAADLDRMK